MNAAETADVADAGADADSFWGQNLVAATICAFCNYAADTDASDADAAVAATDNDAADAVISFGGFLAE